MNARVAIPVIVINAVVQALLVLGDPVPSTSWGFVLFAAASFISVVVAGGLLARTAARVSGYARPLLWSTGLVVVALGAAIINPFIAVAVLLLGTIAAPRIINGSKGFRNIRALGGILTFLVLAALSWVIALLLGFFITGVVAALVTWIWGGVAATLALTQWFALSRRAV